MHPYALVRSWNRSARLPTILVVPLTSLTSASLIAQTSGYTFHPLRTGGGGFVTGIVTHPTATDLVYARTDTSGAYKVERVDANLVRDASLE